jgi:hypothetical protein
VPNRPNSPLFRRLAQTFAFFLVFNRAAAAFPLVLAFVYVADWVMYSHGYCVDWLIVSPRLETNTSVVFLGV